MKLLQIFGQAIRSGRTNRASLHRYPFSYGKGNENFSNMRQDDCEACEAVGGGGECEAGVVTAENVAGECKAYALPHGLVGVERREYHTALVGTDAGTVVGNGNDGGAVGAPGGGDGDTA